MKKVKLYYRMLESNNADAETKDGTTLAIVTDGIAQRLLEGQKVSKVVCYLIALASLQGWSGGCHLVKAEEIVPLSLPELRERSGLTVYDGLERVYRVVNGVSDDGRWICHQARGGDHAACPAKRTNTRPANDRSLANR